MGGPRSYVIRIYRQGFRSLSGMVEDAATKAQRSFRDEKELLAILRNFHSYRTPFTVKKSPSTEK